MFDLDELLAPPERVGALAGSRNLADFAVIEMVGDVLDTGEWQVPGILSVYHWLAWQLGITSSHAGRLVKIAERRNELSAVFKEFSTGSLSLDQMMLIVKYCPTGFDEAVSEVAVHATIRQLRHILSKYAFPEPDPGDNSPEPDATDSDATDSDATDSDATDLDATDSGGADTSSGIDAGDAAAVPHGVAPEELDKPYQGFSYGFSDDGSFKLWLRCGADDGAEISAAMDLARTRTQADTGTPDVTGFESFLNLMRAGVDTEPNGSRASHNRILIHLEESDASVQLLTKSFRRAINLGRSQPTIPNWLRQIVLQRDDSCVFPGCGARRWLDIHHIEHWAHGGRTDTNNLVALCRRHHREHHRGHFTMAGNPDSRAGLTFLDQNQNRIIRAQPTPTPPPTGWYENPTGEPYDSDMVYFDPNEPDPPDHPDEPAR